MLISILVKGKNFLTQLTGPILPTSSGLMYLLQTKSYSDVLEFF